MGPGPASVIVIAGAAIWVPNGALRSVTQIATPSLALGILRNYAIGAAFTRVYFEPTRAQDYRSAVIASMVPRGDGVV